MVRHIPDKNSVYWLSFSQGTSFICGYIGGGVMYCAGGIVFRKNLTLCLAASYSSLSSFNSLCIDKNPEKSGFWRVAKAR